MGKCDCRSRGNLVDVAHLPVPRLSDSLRLGVGRAAFFLALWCRSRGSSTLSTTRSASVKLADHVRHLAPAPDQERLASWTLWVIATAPARLPARAAELLRSRSARGGGRLPIGAPNG